VDLLRWADAELSVIEITRDGEPIIGTEYFVTGDVSLKKDFLTKAAYSPQGSRSEKTLIWQCV